MKMLLVLIFICCFSSSISAQNHYDKYPEKSHKSIAYYFDFVNFERSDSVNTKVDVFVQIPFNKVKFVRGMDGFVAEFSMTVGIYSDKETMLVERTWNEKMNAKSFNETMSQKNFNISRKTFNLRPGKYLVKLLLEDKESKQTFPTEGTLTVRDFQKDFFCSDPVLIASSSANNTKIVPNISHIVYTKDTVFSFFTVLYSKADTTVQMLYSIFNAGNQKIIQKSEFKDVQSGRNQIIAAIDSTHLQAGDYRLMLEVYDGTNKLVYASERGFTCRLSGLPLLITNLDKAVEQLQYIASPSEMDSLKKTTNYEEKLSKFLAFWKKRDRNQATEENEIFTEYYSRVDYANRNFSSYMEGWKTDMGMVLIYLGMPNNIDRHPFDYDSKPYEVWEYYELNRRFIFYDYTGFGDYRLSSPFPGDLYRFQ